MSIVTGKYRQLNRLFLPFLLKCAQIQRYLDKIEMASARFLTASAL